MSDDDKEFDLKEEVILTESSDEEIKVDGFRIKVTPVWKWMLQEKKT